MYNVCNHIYLCDMYQHAYSGASLHTYTGSFQGFPSVFNTKSNFLSEVWPYPPPASSLLLFLSLSSSPSSPCVLFPFVESPRFHHLKTSALFLPLPGDHVPFLHGRNNSPSSSWSQQKGRLLQEAFSDDSTEHFLLPRL